MKKSSRRTSSIVGRRGSGILLHITSLPAPFGIGDFGPWAYKFADFLHRTKQSYWQILPLTPVNYTHEYSPYNCMSAFAGNKYFISPELMVREGLLTRSEIDPAVDSKDSPVDFARAVESKERIFDVAWQRSRRFRCRKSYAQFCSTNKFWLDEWAIFVALCKIMQREIWVDWPDRIRDHHPGTLRSLKQSMKHESEREKFLQYIFARQWHALKRYCNKKGIQIIGDIPIYVDHNSADVWAHAEIFKLNREKMPAYLSGVPPDYFSRSGQLWGNPVYNWSALKRSGYGWWLKRLTYSARLFDLMRVDHFRGFVSYWQVRHGAKSARHGEWVKAPAVHFLNHVKKQLGELHIIAEDLGTITPDVHDVIRRFGLPGMRVLLFAFGDGSPDNPYLPHNHARNCVVYTGTHDNNTVRGWFEHEARSSEKKMLVEYLGRKVNAENVHWELIRLAMMSVADTVIIPMQDILGLGADARMNRPATIQGNWKWRLAPGVLRGAVARKLAELTVIYGRA